MHFLQDKKQKEKWIRNEAMDENRVELMTVGECIVSLGKVAFIFKVKKDIKD